MPKGNGKDQEQAAAQPEGQAPQEQRFPVMALIAINPQSGQMMLQINDQIVQDKIAFLFAVAQLGLGNAMTEYQKQQGPKVLRPNPPGIIKPPGL